MLTIETCERLADYWPDYENHGKRMPKFHAQVKGRPGVWGCGQSREEAIASLISAWREIFPNPKQYNHIQLGRLAR